MDNPELEGAPWRLAETRARMETKSQKIAEGLRATEASAHPRAPDYVAHIEKRRVTLRSRWQVVHDESWWSTATKIEVLRAFIAAYEMSATDPAAAAAGQLMSDRLGVPSPPKAERRSAAGPT